MLAIDVAIFQPFMCVCVFVYNLLSSICMAKYLYIYIGAITTTTTTEISHFELREHTNQNESK